VKAQINANILSLAALLFSFVACNTDPKLSQYKVAGERLYGQYCANCHQANGSGFAMLYPPLAGSDFLKANKDQVICLMRNGISGPIMVNGVEYNLAMKGNSSLTDLEVAEIATYIYTQWGGEGELTGVQEASRILSTCE
jgi:cytochrome c551